MVDNISKPEKKNKLCNNFLLLSEPKNAIGLFNRTDNNVRIKSISDPVKTREENEFNEDNLIFTIQLEADNIALFVWLDFLILSAAPNTTNVLPSKVLLNGIFSKNGFIMTNHTEKVTFTIYEHESLDNKVMKEMLIHSLTVRSMYSGWN